MAGVEGGGGGGVGIGVGGGARIQKDPQANNSN